MKPAKQPFFSPEALEVQARFEQWGQSRPKRGPIPDELWQAAVDLSKHHSVYQVSRLLRLDYSCLKRKSMNVSVPVAPTEEPKEISFFEFPPIRQNPVESCRIELKRPDGTAMQIQLSSIPDTDLSGLIKAFIQ